MAIARSIFSSAIFVAAVLAGFGAAAMVAPPHPPYGPGPPAPSAVGRFAYVIRTTKMNPDGQPARQVRLAQITHSKPAVTAQDEAILLDTADDSSPLTVQSIMASPLNTRVLVYASELPLGAVDQDLRAYDMATGGGGKLFNEHTAAPYIHRATCPSPAFDAYLASEPGGGAGVDFSISVDGADAGNVEAPTILGWIDEERVALRWRFTLHTTDFAVLQDTFDIIVRWPTSGAAPTMVCGVSPPVPHPLTALGAHPVIRLYRWPVGFPPKGKPRQAERIAGVIWP